jgi:hypothetical protein
MRDNFTTLALATGLAMLVGLGGPRAIAGQVQNNSTTKSGAETCPIDTTKDSETGKPRSGIQVCSEGNSVSVGGSTTGKQVAHFFKYPIGQSKKSVAKQVGNAFHKGIGDVSRGVHNFFHHL